VLITSLSDRVSYGDYATGCKVRVLDPSRDVRFFSSVKCPDTLWDKGYGGSSLGVKWQGCRVDHCFTFSGQV